MKPGDFVIYMPEKQIGRVKSVSVNHAYVVYKCSGNWSNFEDYTAAKTDLKDLEKFKDYLSYIHKQIKKIESKPKCNECGAYLEIYGSTYCFNCGIPF